MLRECLQHLKTWITTAVVATGIKNELNEIKLLLFTVKCMWHTNFVPTLKGNHWEIEVTLLLIMAAKTSKQEKTFQERLKSFFRLVMLMIKYYSFKMWHFA